LACETGVLVFEGEGTDRALDDVAVDRDAKPAGWQLSPRAVPGCNLIATANLRDLGVNDMSSALKRRVNLETVLPIADPSFACADGRARCRGHARSPANRAASALCCAWVRFWS
jgi:hypothetical protein